MSSRIHTLRCRNVSQRQVFWSWTGFGIRQELGHSVHPNSGISGAGERRRRRQWRWFWLLLSLCSKVAQHTTHNTVGNEPEAVTFPLLDSKTPPGRAKPPPGARCFVCFALLNQHCRRHRMHRDAARARGSPGAFKCTVERYDHAEEVNETHPVGKADCLAPE